MSVATAPPSDRAAAHAKSWFEETQALDLLAASPLIVLYALAVVQQAPGLIHEAAAIALGRLSFVSMIELASKATAFFFAAVMIGLLMTRRAPSLKARGLLPRMAALVGTCLGVGLLIFPRHPVGWVLEAISTLLIFGGTAFALYGLVWLGRSFSIMPQARRLVTGGPYSVVRNPLYLGEGIALFGAALQFMSPAVLAVLVAQFAFQIYRIGFEEQVLGEAYPEYAAYKSRTARLIPGIY